MQEYLNMGHMSRVDLAEKVSNDCKTQIFYLPHHGVSNESSVTTKLRVVFDGSAKSASGVSLNDILKPGPRYRMIYLLF